MYPPLNDLLRQVAVQPVDDRLTDDALIAHSATALRMLHFAAACPTEQDSIRPTRCEARIGMLQAILRQRCADDQPLARRSRLLPTLYELTYGAGSAFDPRQEAACRAAMDRLIGAWRASHPNEASASTPEARETLHGVVRCMTQLLYWMDEADRKEDDDYRFYQQLLEAWAAEAKVPDGWSNLSIDEALDRVELMQRNAWLLLEDRHAATVEQLRRRCWQRIASPFGRTAAECAPRQFQPEVTGRRLFLLEAAMQHGIAQPAAAESAAVTAMAARLVERYAPESEDWLYGAAICIGAQLRELQSRIREQQFARIA